MSEELTDEEVDEIVLEYNRYYQPFAQTFDRDDLADLKKIRNRAIHFGRKAGKTDIGLGKEYGLGAKEIRRILERTDENGENIKIIKTTKLTKDEYKNRNKDIYVEFMGGSRQIIIAEKYGISQGRVWQIIARMKRRLANYKKCKPHTFAHLAQPIISDGHGYEESYTPFQQFAEDCFR